jgi:NhaA family Na+:H+ antiporter
VLRSGVHATIAGVALGLLVPATSTLSLRQFRELGGETMEEFCQAEEAGDTAHAERAMGALEYLLHHSESPVDRLTRKVNPWVAFLVLPLFALANAGVSFTAASWNPLLHSPVAWGIVLGLVLGKPIGILVTCWLTTTLGLSRLPQTVSWPQFAAVGVLAGIGFTVSLFIGGLAFADASQADAARAAVLAASLLAGIAGFALLSRAMPRHPSKG